MSSEVGVSLETHRSRILSQDDLEWADVIVLMDRFNWARLRMMGADPEKLVWIGSLQAGSVEIPDPYGLKDVEVRQILDRLKRASETLCMQLNATRR